MKRGSGDRRVRSFQGAPYQYGSSSSYGLRQYSRGVLVLIVSLICLVPGLFVLQARRNSGNTQSLKANGVALQETIISKEVPTQRVDNHIELDLFEPDPVICSGPPTRAVLSLPDPVARAEERYAQESHGDTLRDVAPSLRQLVKDCYDRFVKEGGEMMTPKRDTGDKALAKMIEACFLESDVADLEARRAVYESIYVVTVLKLYSSFDPKDILIVRSEDLSPAGEDGSASAAVSEKVQALEEHLSACQYKIKVKPLKLRDKTTHPLHDVFVAWNVKLSHLVGRDISWDDTAPDPAEVEEANKKKREEEAASSGGRPMSVEERVLALLKGAPVMIFSKTYCPYSKAAKAVMSAAGADMQVLELDVDPQGQDIQRFLAQMTGRRTVPNVFVRGKSIGGGDDTRALHDRGELVPMLQKADALKK